MARRAFHDGAAGGDGIIAANQRFFAARILCNSQWCPCYIAAMRLIRFLAFGGLLLCASAALGQVSGSWVGGSSGSWSNAANWSSNPQFPSGGGAATLGLQNAGVLDVTLDSSVSLDFLGFFGPAVSRVNGGSLTFSPAGVVHVGRNDASGTTLAPEPRISSTAASFTKIGDGTLSIVGTQNAPIRVTEGVLRTTAGAGTIELNGGTLLNPNSRPSSFRISRMLGRSRWLPAETS